MEVLSGNKREAETLGVYIKDVEDPHTLFVIGIFCLGPTLLFLFI